MAGRAGQKWLSEEQKDLVRKLVLEDGMTQVEAADRTGIRRSTVGNIIRATPEQSALATARAERAAVIEKVRRLYRGRRAPLTIAEITGLPIRDVQQICNSKHAGSGGSSLRAHWARKRGEEVDTEDEIVNEDDSAPLIVSCALCTWRLEAPAREALKAQRAHMLDCTEIAAA